MPSLIGVDEAACAHLFVVGGLLPAPQVVGGRAVAVGVLAVYGP